MYFFTQIFKGPLRWMVFATLLGGGAMLLWLSFGKATLEESANTTGALDNQHWLGQAMEPISGSVEREGSRVVVELDSTGQAVLELPFEPLPADRYRFLIVNTAGQSNVEHIELIWWTSVSSLPVQRAQLPELTNAHRAALRLDGWAGFWLDLKENPAWRGQVLQSALSIRGQPASSVTVRDVRLLSKSAGDFISAAFAGWANYEPWQQWSINRYSGKAPDFLAGYRVPIIAGALALAFAGYALLLAAMRQKCKYDWRLASGLLLLGWIALDAPWQWSLFRQLSETNTSFSGKSARQKALNAEDAIIFELVESIQPLLGAPSTRVFVASPHEYLALRSVYRLLPFNAFWARGRRAELPAADHLHPGDFVLVLESEKVRYDSTQGQLLWPEDESTPAARIFSHQLGDLYRVL